MSNPQTLHCEVERRREAVRESALNGIDYLEVANREQTELRVYLFHEAPEDLTESNFRIEGGRRIRDLQVTRLDYDPEARDRPRITVDRAGDFSPYVLRIVETEDARPTGERHREFDPRYSQVSFSFKANCPSSLDCKAETICPPEPREEPEINYLAKDYASFRQLILDRLALIMPDWRERHVPDIGIALVEVLAYVGDHLSYFQDAVATEAYLDTSRQRISVRRHARLVDYHMHEGCNARAWITITTDQDLVDGSFKMGNLYFTTGSGDGEVEVFEPLWPNSDAPLRLYVAHNSISFYTWGDEQCCLPRGATSATLKNEWVFAGPSEPKQPSPGQDDAEQCPPPPPEPEERERKLHLKPGDVLIFEEVIGPKTGAEVDADPNRRHVVRLSKVTEDVDPLCDQPVLEIEWVPADALPFPFCLSARLPAPNCKRIYDVSVARGNVILVDHGRTIDPPEDIGQVSMKAVTGECACDGSVVELSYQPAVFRPVLKESPLTFSEPLPDNPWAPASRLPDQDPRRALPQIARLTGVPGICAEGGNRANLQIVEGIDMEDPVWQWYPRRDLFGSQRNDPHYVVEMDDARQAHLRFGDGELGRVPEACMRFTAQYRVGNGPAGNVGADTITTAAWRIQTVSGLTLKPRNPIPACGGTAPEPVAEVKLFAPGACRNPGGIQRAIIADDYARIVEREFAEEVQRAGASLRWAGSWYAAQVSLDPLGREVPGEALRDRVKGRLHRYRRMGHDVEVPPTHYVSLLIEMTVCALPDFLRGHVEAALLELFSNRLLLDGRRGFFHPDNLTFGEGIYLSKIVAAAQAVPGVESVFVTKLQRLGEGDQGELADGVLALGPLEIARLDNDPSFPEHGSLKLKIGGGR